MLNLSANLQTQITSQHQTLCWCWRITRNDNAVIRLTNHDRDLYIDGTYQALGGYTPSAVDTALGWDSQNQSLQAILDTPAITEADLDKGLYDFARLECFLVDYTDLPVTLLENPAKRITLYKAILGKVTRTNNRYTFEARGFEYLLNNKIGAVTSKFCRAKFGDTNCKVNLNAHTYNLSVATVLSSRRQFTLSPANIAITPPGTALTLTSSATTWADAESQAIALGGHLVTIRNQSENQRILDLFGTDQLWIGLYKDVSENWVWSSGEPVTYTNWFFNEPNNAGNVESRGEINHPGQTPGSWNDDDNNDLKYGIIEFPAPSTNYTNAPDRWFDYGTVTFTSGANVGAIHEIATYTNNTVTLFEGTAFNIQPGDTIAISTGCDKTLRNCFRYNNVVNFQGEPYIPTPDKFAATPIEGG